MQDFRRPENVSAPNGPVFVINLARAVDRRLAMERELAQAGFVPGEVEMVRAVDARDLTLESLARRGAKLFSGWRLPGLSVPFHARDLKWGEVACSLSHFEVWRRIAASAAPFALVLEDDVELVGDARAIQRALWSLAGLAPHWDLCYVGRRRQGFPVGSVLRPERKLGPNLVVPTFSYGAYAYAVSRAGAAKLLEAGLERAIVPVDEFLPALYTAHVRQDIRDVFGRGDRLRAFAIDPDLVRMTGVHPSTIEPSESIAPIETRVHSSQR